MPSLLRLGTCITYSRRLGCNPLPLATTNHAEKLIYVVPSWGEVGRIYNRKKALERDVYLLGIPVYAVGL